ncbi:mandelate racemase/muconate lactonizing enzyme family protein [Variovorax sp. KK3]|uniref:mandelate racemase/muconate lactonizing enzyme family protein n=1 Tax=Variovorax sp. KK3 TaxID=1855728 RepID=UPI00097C49FD|nr:enolase C-terminal domain-like protein [Variovorax sp. KK3]
MDSTRIRSVEGIPLKIPFAKSFTMAAPHQATRNEVEVYLVRITTDDGVVGIGETQAWRRQGSSETLHGLHAKLQSMAAPALVGRSVLDIAPVMHALSEQLSGGLYLQAAVGDALYDAKARTLGLSVAQMLGGRCRDHIDVGIALGITGDAKAMIDAAERAVEQGYRHLRIKIGIDARKDLLGLQALRAHFDDRVVLRADANGSMRYGDALRLLRQLEPLDLDIVEQPLAAWDLEGMAALAAAVRIPLSADEAISDTHSLVDVASRRAARVIQTKSAKNGGIHSIAKLWTLAGALGIDIFPGNHPSTSLNVAAVAQLAASWPQPLLAGDFQTGLVDMLADDIVQVPVRVEGGRVHVPEGHGMGVALDEDKVRRYRVDVQ